MSHLKTLLGAIAIFVLALFLACSGDKDPFIANLVNAIELAREEPPYVEAE